MPDLPSPYVVALRLTIDTVFNQWPKTPDSYDWESFRLQLKTILTDKQEYRRFMLDFRLCVTGESVGMGLFDILNIMGPERVQESMRIFSECKPNA